MVYYNEFDEPTAWWLKGLSDNGVPNRVLKYRGYGNAIVPQVGALFTRALLGI